MNSLGPREDVPLEFRSSPVSGAGGLYGVSRASDERLLRHRDGQYDRYRSLVLSPVAKATSKTALEASAAKGSCTLSAKKLPVGTYRPRRHLRREHEPRLLGFAKEKTSPLPSEELLPVAVRLAVDG